MHKLARIAYNTNGWERPSGDAGRLETKGTYNSLTGYGHEEWLFRRNWIIGGWRYAFLQGVNKAAKEFVNSGQPFDVTLFTIQPDKRRRWVGHIREVECLSEERAKAALAEFRARGWYDIMLHEIAEVGGDVSALGKPGFADHILNVRFRTENVTLSPPKLYAAADDPVQKLWRYKLYNAPATMPNPVGSSGSQDIGSPEPPIAKPYWRRAVAAVEVSPEHLHIQNKLLEQLKSEHPAAKIVREDNFIDIAVKTIDKLIIYEIKSDQMPKTVIRNALGQILEYAYHPSRSHTLPIELVIVGQKALSPDDQRYLAKLKTEFGLPLNYRVVSL